MEDDDHDQELFRSASPTLIASAHARAAQGSWTGKDADDFVRAFVVSTMRERERCRAIVLSREAQHRHALAVHLATRTDIDTDEALAALRVAPADAA